MGGGERPLLAVTLGDTAGIGPEIVLKTIADPEARNAARMLVVGDAELLRARAGRLGIDCDLQEVRSAAELREGGLDAGVLSAAGRGADENVIGEVDARAGRASVAWVKEAARLAVAGEVEGVVTAPMNKLALKTAGFDYEGHTEILGEVTGAAPVMMLVGAGPHRMSCAPTAGAGPHRMSCAPTAGAGLRVAIVTRHCALRDVPGLLKKDEIVRTARVVAESLARDFGIAEPKVGVLALNPHASDGGRFGDEEERLIAPAIAELKASGIDVLGPLVPDVAFWEALRGAYDALVAMYHDQGLIPLKTLAFDRGVNVTLGLPIVRTSPDHGTAFEIAADGTASHVSMVEAVKLCATIVTYRKRGNA